MLFSQYLLNVGKRCFDRRAGRVYLVESHLVETLAYFVEILFAYYNVSAYEKRNFADTRFDSFFTHPAAVNLSLTV